MSTKKIVTPPRDFFMCIFCVHVWVRKASYIYHLWLLWTRTTLLSSACMWHFICCLIILATSFPHSHASCLVFPFLTKEKKLKSPAAKRKQTQTVSKREKEKTHNNKDGDLYSLFSKILLQSSFYYSLKYRHGHN